MSTISITKPASQQSHISNSPDDQLISAYIRLNTKKAYLIRIPHKISLQRLYEVVAYHLALLPSQLLIITKGRILSQAYIFKYTTSSIIHFTRDSPTVRQESSISASKQHFTEQRHVTQQKHETVEKSMLEGGLGEVEILVEQRQIFHAILYKNIYGYDRIKLHVKQLIKVYDEDNTKQYALDINGKQYISASNLHLINNSISTYETAQNKSTVPYLSIVTDPVLNNSSTHSSKSYPLNLGASHKPKTRSWVHQYEVDGISKDMVIKKMIEECLGMVDVPLIDKGSNRSNIGVLLGDTNSNNSELPSFIRFGELKQLIKDEVVLVYTGRILSHNKTLQEEFVQNQAQIVVTFRKPLPITSLINYCTIGEPKPIHTQARNDQKPSLLMTFNPSLNLQQNKELITIDDDNKVGTIDQVLSQERASELKSQPVQALNQIQEEKDVEQGQKVMITENVNSNQTGTEEIINSGQQAVQEQNNREQGNCKSPNFQQLLVNKNTQPQNQTFQQLEQQVNSRFQSAAIHIEQGQTQQQHQTNELVMSEQGIQARLQQQKIQPQEGNIMEQYESNLLEQSKEESNLIGDIQPVRYNGFSEEGHIVNSFNDQRHVKVTQLEADSQPQLLQSVNEHFIQQNQQDNDKDQITQQMVQEVIDQIVSQHLGFNNEQKQQSDLLQDNDDQLGNGVGVNNYLEGDEQKGQSRQSGELMGEGMTSLEQQPQEQVNQAQQQQQNMEYINQLQHQIQQPNSNSLQLKQVQQPKQPTQDNQPQPNNQKPIQLQKDNSLSYQDNTINYMPPQILDLNQYNKLEVSNNNEVLEGNGNILEGCDNHGYGNILQVNNDHCIREEVQEDNSQKIIKGEGLESEKELIVLEAGKSAHVQHDHKQNSNEKYYFQTRLIDGLTGQLYMDNEKNAQTIKQWYNIQQQTQTNRLIQLKKQPMGLSIQSDNNNKLLLSSNSNNNNSQQQQQQQKHRQQLQHQPDNQEQQQIKLPHIEIKGIASAQSLQQQQRASHESLPLLNPSEQSPSSRPVISQLLSLKASDLQIPKSVSQEISFGQENTLISSIQLQNDEYKNEISNRQINQYLQSYNGNLLDITSFNVKGENGSDKAIKDNNHRQEDNHQQQQGYKELIETFKQEDMHQRQQQQCVKVETLESAQQQKYQQVQEYNQRQIQDYKQGQFQSPRTPFNSLEQLPAQQQQLHLHQTFDIQQPPINKLESQPIQQQQQNPIQTIQEPLFTATQDPNVLQTQPIQPITVSVHYLHTDRDSNSEVDQEQLEPPQPVFVESDSKRHVVFYLEGKEKIEEGNIVENNIENVENSTQGKILKEQNSLQNQQVPLTQQTITVSHQLQHQLQPTPHYEPQEQQPHLPQLQAQAFQQRLQTSPLQQPLQESHSHSRLIEGHIQHINGFHQESFQHEQDIKPIQDIELQQPIEPIRQAPPVQSIDVVIPIQLLPKQSVEQLHNQPHTSQISHPSQQQQDNQLLNSNLSQHSSQYEQEDEVWDHSEEQVQPKVKFTEGDLLYTIELDLNPKPKLIDAIAYQYHDLLCKDLQEFVQTFGNIIPEDSFSKEPFSSDEDKLKFKMGIKNK